MIKLSVGGLEATLIALDHTTINLRVAGLAAVEAAGRVLLTETRRAITRQDHTLQDLADLDHPYARRHRSIQIHRDTPWWVHKQKGELVTALYGASLSGPGGQPAFEVGLNPIIAPHAVFVTQGTKRMLPRDPIWSVASLPSTQDKMMRAIVKELGQKMRTKLGIRFGAGAPVNP